MFPESWTRKTHTFLERKQCHRVSPIAALFFALSIAADATNPQCSDRLLLQRYKNLVSKWDDCGNWGDKPWKFQNTLVLSMIVRSK